MKSSQLFTKVPLACVASLCLSSCASSPTWREPWVYGISRTLYESDAYGPVASDFVSNCGCNQDCAMAFVVVLVAPFAIDTVLLPVTVPHDLLFAR